MPVFTLKRLFVALLPAHLCASAQDINHTQQALEQPWNAPAQVISKQFMT